MIADLDQNAVVRKEFVFLIGEDDDMLTATCREPQMSVKAKNLDELRDEVHQLVKGQLDPGDERTCWPIRLRYPPYFTYDQLAMASLVIPLCAAAVLFFIYLGAKTLFNPALLGCNFLAVIASPVLAIISLWNAEHHEGKSSCWIAVAAILVSAAVLPIAFLAYAFTGLGHNC